MADIADLGSELEEKQRDWAIQDALNRPTEEAEYDEHHRRICKECGITISMMRLMAVPHAVRCMPCQEAYEGER